jgi:6-phosphogluconolactonase
VIEICRFSTPADIANEAARRASKTLLAAQQNHRAATFVVAGGRLPPVAYDVLNKKYAEAIDWTNVVFLIGDERCVPLDDPESSWLSLLPLLNSHPEIPPDHRLRPKSNLTAEQAARDYEAVLLKLPKNDSGSPVFNHFWFGIGEDGHTLSLFPHHSSSEQATDALVIPVHSSPKPPPDRISFSYKALEGVESAVAFISGSGKATIVEQIAGGDHSLPFVIASQTIDQAGGHVTWLVDDEAMSLVPDGQLLVV